MKLPVIKPKSTNVTFWTKLHASGETEILSHRGVAYAYAYLWKSRNISYIEKTKKISLYPYKPVLVMYLLAKTVFIYYICWFGRICSLFHEIPKADG